MIPLLKISLLFTIQQLFSLALNILQKKKYNMHIFIILGFNIITLIATYFNIICSFKYFPHILMTANLFVTIFDIYKNNFKK